MTTTRELTQLATGGGFFEGPRWHDDRWWVSDHKRHAVFTYTPEGVEDLVFVPTDTPSGLGFMPDGSLLYVCMNEQRIYRRSVDGSTTLHADVSSLCVDQLNDLVVDERGYAYAGFTGFDVRANEAPSLAAVICIRPDGEFFAAAEGLCFPNGMVITDDGKTLIVGESFGPLYTAFDINPDGSLTNRRPWAVLGSPPDLSSTAFAMLDSLDVIIDGCCLDAEGAIWSAECAGRRVIRIAEGGEILDVIPAPDGMNVYACMLGGSDGKTLLLCVSPDNLTQGPDDRNASLWTTRVEIPAAGRP